MIFEVKKPGKKIKEICTKLGESYCIRVFDLENVIYRNLENGYDFEISGLDNRKQSFDATLFIWQTQPEQRVVEQISNIDSFEDLAAELEKATKKYLDLA